MLGFGLYTGRSVFACGFCGRLIPAPKERVADNGIVYNVAVA